MSSLVVEHCGKDVFVAMLQQGSDGLVVTFGPTDSIGRVWECLEGKEADKIRDERGIDARAIAPRMNVANVPSPGHYLESQDPYYEWYKRIVDGEFQLLESNKADPPGPFHPKIDLSAYQHRAPNPIDVGMAEELYQKGYKAIHAGPDAEIEYHSQALQRNPNLAKSWHCLANAYMVKNSFPTEANARAAEEIARANGTPTPEVLQKGAIYRF
jgi:hypothetical protein